MPVASVPKMLTLKFCALIRPRGEGVSGIVRVALSSAFVFVMVSFDQDLSISVLNRPRTKVFLMVTCSARSPSVFGGLTRTYCRSKRRPSLVISAAVTSTGPSDLMGYMKICASSC